MKKMNTSVSLLLLCMVLLLSCKKSIDLNPTYTVNGDEFFKAIDDYDFALTGAYQRLKQNGLYSGVNGGSIFLSSVDIAADNFYSGPNNLGNLNTMFRWNYTADNTATQGGWDEAYRVIQQANLTLRGIDKFRATDPLKVNRIEGQARALRAFMHFEIFRWWAPDYDPNSTGPGIAYMEAFDIEQKPARLTVKQTYAKVEDDLKIAKAMLSNTDKPVQSVTSVAGTGRAYVDTLVVDAMLARMYLYARQWDSATRYATFVINARRLATGAEFPGIWQDATTAEVIWSVNYGAGDPALAREIFQPGGNRPTTDLISWRPVTALLNLYGPGDIRGPAYFTTRNGSVVLNKYLAKAASVVNPDGVVNFKVFRTAEMYLIRAEALAVTAGGQASALADLNALRSARGASTGTESGATLITAIQTERRKELAMEGHRFFDVKRNVRTINRTQSCSSYCTLLPADRAWALPVPQPEMLANPNMKQNPGY